MSSSPSLLFVSFQNGELMTYQTDLVEKDSPYCGRSMKALLWSQWYYNAVFDNYNYWVDPYSCSSVGWESTSDTSNTDDFDVALQMSRTLKVAVNVCSSPVVLTIEDSNSDKEEKPTTMTFVGVPPLHLGTIKGGFRIPIPLKNNRKEF